MDTTTYKRTGFFFVLNLNAFIMWGLPKTLFTPQDAQILYGINLKFTLCTEHLHFQENWLNAKMAAIECTLSS